MWVTLALAGLTVIAFVRSRIPLELTSVSLVAALLFLFHVARLPSGEAALSAVDLLKGFANPALLAVVALLVIGQGLVRTGALDAVSQGIYYLTRGRATLAIAITLAAAMVISALLNNTPIVVIFIPIFASLAERLGQTASRVMMPLSFCAILGGMTTLIGSSTNLLVSGTATELGLAPLNFFDFTIPGLILVAIGLPYVLFIAPRLLKDSNQDAEATGKESGRQFVAQFSVQYDSPLVGTKSVGGMFPTFQNMTVLLVERGTEIHRPPFEDITLSPGDVVVVAATRKALTEAVSRGPGLRLRSSVALDDEELPPSETESESGRRSGGLVAEVMVSPGSRMIGLPMEQVAFPTSSRTDVIGIQRRARMTRSHVNEVRLEAGDVLLVHGKARDVRSLRANRDVVLMEWSAAELPSYHHARRAGVIFCFVVGLAAAELLPITITALGGAALMIISGCLNVRQASRAIDRQILMVGGAALALNAALTATGGGEYIATSLLSGLDGAAAPIVLSAFFLLVAVLTNVLSNNACAVLFTPIGINIAYALGVDPFIFIVTVILAANCSFASPIGYVTNLLVMAPGRYRFIDFARVGGPLIILLWIGYSIFAPWYYGLW